MDLRRLGLFLAVADHGGFTAAARAAHVAQPAVSLAVRELETELGTLLFVRSRTGARLTPAGEALVGPARQARRDVEVATAAVAAVTGLVAGRLDVASLPTLAAAPVAGLVGSFRRLHPEVSVRLTAPADNAAVATAVRTGAAEVGVTEQGTTGELPEVAVARQDLVAVFAPPAGRRAGTGTSPLSLRALARLDLVVTPPGTSLRTALETAFAAAGLRPRIAVETEQRDALVPLAVAGAGVAVVPHALAAPAVALGAVVRRLRPELTRTVVVTHRPGALSPAARAFLDLAPRTS